LREGQGRSRISIFGPAEGQKWQLLRAVESVLIGEPWDICYYAPSSSLLVTDHGSNVSLKTVKVENLNVYFSFFKMFH